jgi:CheY-like chemotaxis protein
VRSVFERHGYRVIEAVSGKAALGVWRDHHSKIDLVLTDLIMPDGITGIMLAEQLRERAPRTQGHFQQRLQPGFRHAKVTHRPGQPVSPEAV